MKDRFHYLQPAYNAVGTEAGQQVGAASGVVDTLRPHLCSPPSALQKLSTKKRPGS